MQLCAAFVSQLQNSYNHIDVMFIEFLLGHLISQLFACDPTSVFAKKAVEILVPPRWQFFYSTFGFPKVLIEKFGNRRKWNSIFSDLFGQLFSRLFEIGGHGGDRKTQILTAESAGCYS